MSDQIRGFPPFPAGPGRRARSWWATAWLRAWEEAALDPQPLRRGRRYAAGGQVGSITVSPGRLAASVHDGDPDAAHRTRVLVDPLSDDDWDRFTVAVAGRAGFLAALLDQEMPRELATAAGEVGVRLLPGPDELHPDCDCPDWDFPCRHVAAVCHQVSWLLDADPFLLLLLRGRGERMFLAGLRASGVPSGQPIGDRVHLPSEDGHGPTGSTAPEKDDDRAGGTAPEDGTGIPGNARDDAMGTPAVLAYTDPVAGLPPSPPPVVVVGTVTSQVLPTAPGVDPELLARLVIDAATRAAALLAGAAGPAVGGHPAGCDAASEVPGPPKRWSDPLTDR